MSSSDSEGEADHRSVISQRTKGAYSTHACPHPDCDKFFTRPSRLETHLLSHTGKRPFKCTVEGCGKDYARRAHLIRHTANSHSNQEKTGEKRIDCSQCDATFSNKYGLKKHWLKCHDPNNKSVKQFSCDVCGQKFSRRPSLKQHRAIVHPELDKPHQCQQCEKRFLYPKDLTSHVRAQHERSHKCEICQEKFLKWTAYRTHKAKEHPKVFKCAKCPRQFKTKHEFLVHKSTVHSDERSVFQCTYEACDKKYFFEKNLKVHIQVDHEGLRFPCQKCDSVFKAKITLKRHVKNVHVNGKIVKKVGGIQHGQRHPREGSTALAVELSGFKTNEIDKKLTKDIIMKSGKVQLSAEALSNEISKTFMSSFENRDEIESSDVESVLDSTIIKNEPCIPDLLIPMRLWKNEDTETEEEVEIKKDKKEKNVRKSYDFSNFIKSAT